MITINHNNKNFKKLTVTTTVLSNTTTPPGEVWPMCQVQCPHCGAMCQHNVLHSCGRYDCPTLFGADGPQCPGYNLVLGVECSCCGAVQEPGLHCGSCLTCGEPQGQCIARLCEPEMQILKEQATKATKSAMTRMFQSKAKLKASQTLRHNGRGSNLETQPQPQQEPGATPKAQTQQEPGAMLKA